MMHMIDPAYPCEDVDPSQDAKFFGLSKIDYAMIHIMAGMAASGHYNFAADVADIMRDEAYSLAKAALSVGENI